MYKNHLKISTSYKIYVGKAYVLKKKFKDFFILILNKMAGLNIRLTKKVAHRAKKLFYKIIIYDGPLNKDS